MELGIGKRIRQRRNELKMTQEELAYRMGYKSKAAICKVENGEDNITSDRVSKFAKALNCSPAYIMGWESDGWENYIPPEGTPTYIIQKYEFSKNPQFMEYVLKMWSLPPDNLEFVYNQIDFQIDWVDKEKRKKDGSSLA